MQGKPVVTVGVLAWAVNVVLVWMLDYFGNVEVPQEVGSAMAVIFMAIFVYVAPFLPQKPA